MKTDLQHHFPAEPCLALEVWVALTAKQNVSRRKAMCLPAPPGLPLPPGCLGSPSGEEAGGHSSPCWSIQAGVAGKECGEAVPAPALFEAAGRAQLCPRRPACPPGCTITGIITVGRAARPRAAGIGNGDDLTHKRMVSPNSSH